MRIAAFGDIHGHWVAFRDVVAGLHAEQPLDLVLQCGDAQPFRNEADMEYMNCPQRFRILGDFHKFHVGDETFPVPLLFIGGNHEPWLLLDENKGESELAPNISFMGRVGMCEIDDLKIAGVSGVYSDRYHNTPHMDVPYPVNRRKQASYFNDSDMDAALSLREPDILLLHQWPDVMEDARKDSWPGRWKHPGCGELSVLLECLSPRWCFCGHMHRPEQHRHQRTQITCLSDFHRDQVNSHVILDTEEQTITWPEGAAFHEE